MTSSQYQTRENEPTPAFTPSANITLTTFPPELMVKIASTLDPRTILALIHTSPEFTYLFCVFTSQYTKEQVVLDRSYTPLQYFVSRGVDRAVVHILEVGTDPNYASSGNPKFQKTPLIHAIHAGNARMVSLLLRYGARVEYRDDTGCWAFKDGPNPQCHNELGFTPLQSALMLQHEVYNLRSVFPKRAGPGATILKEIVQLLLDAGADVNACTDRGHTPLHIACGMLPADLVIISALVTAGANIGCTTRLRRNHIYDCLVQPIHLAAVTGNTLAVQLLLSAGVDVDSRTHDGMRPLDLAILGMHATTFEVLVEAGANMMMATPCDDPVLRAKHDPLRMMENTISWVDLEGWFKSRGWRWRRGALRMWAGHPLPIHGLRSARCGFVRRW